LKIYDFQQEIEGGLEGLCTKNGHDVADAQNLREAASSFAC
jgi:hypothetical protein